MVFANRISIDRFNDHFVIHFSAAETKDGEAEEVASVVLPLTIGVELALKLFEAMYSSMIELQAHFVDIQRTIDSLNNVAENAKAEQAQAQAATKQAQAQAAKK